VNIVCDLAMKFVSPLSSEQSAKRGGGGDGGGGGGDRVDCEVQTIGILISLLQLYSARCLVNDIDSLMKHLFYDQTITQR